VDLVVLVWFSGEGVVSSIPGLSKTKRAKENKGIRRKKLQVVFFLGRYIVLASMAVGKWERRFLIVRASAGVLRCSSCHF